MATYPVKHMHGGMRGAPQISGTAGTLVEALRAFLITGFGQVQAQGVQVANGIATCTLNAGETFGQDTIILVQGAQDAALNGEQRVLSATNTQVTWATAAADGPAGGSITLKVAPVGGWQELFPGEPHIAAFRPADPLAPHCLRLDDSDARCCAVRAYESMSDLHTGTAPFPLNTQAPDGAWWVKSTQAGANPVQYLMAADAQFIYCAIACNSVASPLYTACALRGFGMPLPLAPSGDAWATCLSCALHPSSFNTTNSHCCAGSLSGIYEQANQGRPFCARTLAGMGGSAAVKTGAYCASNQDISKISGADDFLGAFPSSVDGQLKLTSRYLMDYAGKIPRADLPGLHHIAQSNVLQHIQHGDKIVVPATGSAPARTLRAVALPQYNASYNNMAGHGAILVDITGPWR